MLRPMRVASLLPAAALLVLAAASWGEEPADLEAAKKQAAEVHKPVLIKFGSEF